MTVIRVYRVSVLHDLWMAWRCLTVPAKTMTVGKRLHRAGRCLSGAIKRVARHARRRQWRELKNDFNGYLAEPEPWPAGVHRCGSGWTRKRALWSLRRQVRRPGVLWEATDREIERMLSR